MSWHTKNTYGYLRSSTEAYDNAKMIYDILAYCGWHLAPICAAIGNSEVESGYNPWRWQNENVLDKNDPIISVPNQQHAYGLFQQDPPSKYIYDSYAQGVYGYGPNYSNEVGNINDGSAQVFYLNHVCADPNAGEWADYWGSSYYMNFDDFIIDDIHSPTYLAETFRVSYERGNPSPERGAAAEYWFSVFQGVTPDPPPYPPGTGARAIPVWLFIKIIHDRSIQHGRKMINPKYYKKW